MPAKKGERRRLRPHLDFLLSQASPLLPLGQRLQWLSDIFWWVRTPGKVQSAQLSFASGQGQLARVRYFLMVLQRNQDWQSAVAKTLRSIVRDTQSVDLFSSTGMPSRMGLLQEVTERLVSRILPPPPLVRELAELFGDWFPRAEDADWIEKIDAETLLQIGRLLFSAYSKDEAGWNTLKRDMEDALLLLVSQVRVQGLSSEIRKRSSNRGLRESPFFHLVEAAQDFAACIHAGTQDTEAGTQQPFQAFGAALGLCRREIQVVQAHLNEYGVSLGVVYQLARMEAELQRIRTLAELLSGGLGPERIVKFFGYLVRESVHHRSVKYLLKENVELLSRRIVDRNAETGSHYITRSRAEYLDMLKKAAGGGVITAPVVLIKVVLEHAGLPFFIKGALISANYSVSFIAIQLCGFTLATKQPAMTAPALAAKMSSVARDGDLFPLISEITSLVRSQFAAVLGNVLAVIPCVVLFHFSYLLAFDDTILAKETALKVMGDHFFVGMTPFYAIQTGVILWFSSLIAGYVDNWAAYRQVPAAIAANRRLQYFLGARRAERIRVFLDRNLSALGGYIGLGFLMGMVPKIGKVLGLPLDVRHVTLSTGMVTVSVLSYGIQDLTVWQWLNIAAGLFSIGLLNVGVSFGLALAVAIGARKIGAPKRKEMYRVLLRKAMRRPLAFFLPTSQSKN